MSNQASTDALSRFDGVNLILAILLIAAPWLLGYSGDYNTAAMSVASGLVICACVISTVSEYTHAFREIDLALGVMTAAAPLFHFGSDQRAVVAHLLVGGAVALISAGELLIPKHQPQQVDAFWHFWDDKQ
jgi:hypothetical protein